MVRTVLRIVDGVTRQEGNGVQVRRVLPLVGLEHVNPFLLIEEIPGVNLAAGDVRTAPPHPTRGFEQITWVLSGSITHGRADGDTVIGANRAEWVTTGAGDLHKETLQAGVDVRALRIWISLARSDRDAERRAVTVAPGSDSIQAWTAARTPGDPIQVDLLAGSLLGARPPVQPRARVTVARLRIPADMTFLHSVVSIEPDLESSTVVLYGLEARAFVGPGPAGAPAERLVRAQQLAILTPPGAGPLARPPLPNDDEIRIRTEPGQTFDVLWLSGLPVGRRANEPFVRRGPFAMRTEEEILQAVEDFRTGRFGTLAP